MQTQHEKIFNNRLEWSAGTYVKDDMSPPSFLSVPPLPCIRRTIQINIIPVVIINKGGKRNSPRIRDPCPFPPSTGNWL